MRKYARSRSKLAKAARASENMHAARRCDGCENMQTVTNTQIEVSHITNSPTQTRETVESTHLQNIIARRLGAATFYTRGNFVAGAVQFGSLLVFLLDLNFLVSL